MPGALSTSDHESNAKAVHKKHLQLLGAALPEVDAAISVDPSFYDVWLNFAATAVGAQGPLAPKDSHLIALAAYAQCTQLSGTGVRQHMRAALANGATPDEIMDVCKLITSMGVHAVALAVPVLIDEWGTSP
jgi:alkylhydroperoxidase/carboxymuconolactone decarboxylase family protein YurZ